MKLNIPLSYCGHFNILRAPFGLRTWQNFLDKNSWVLENQIYHSACPRDKWIRTFFSYSDSLKKLQACRGSNPDPRYQCGALTNNNIIEVTNWELVSKLVCNRPEKVEDKNNGEYRNLYYSSLSSNNYIKFTYCIHLFILTHSVAHLF